MDKNKDFEMIQPWENELARIMCSENISLLQERIQLPHLNPDLGQELPTENRLAEDTYAGYQEFLKQRREMLQKAVEIIREVKVDCEGNRIMTPQQWLEKTASMTEEEKNAFSLPQNKMITDVRNHSSYHVPVSLADNFKRLFEVGIRQATANSGRMADESGRRDANGYPYVLSAVARPLSRVTFEIRTTPGDWNCLTQAQVEDVQKAAKEAGWVAEKWHGKYISLMLPIAQSGITADALAASASDKLETVQPGWREKDDWQQTFVREFKKQLKEQGGRIIYSEQDLADAWNRLTDAIVLKTRQRWERDYPRVTDIQVNKKLNRETQSAEHTIRCRIDGQQQMSRTMHPLDGGRYDKAVKVGEDKVLTDLKKELAGTYYSNELRTEQQEYRGMKR